MRPVTLLLAAGTVFHYSAYALTVSIADLSQCGQVCVNNGLNVATKLQCPSTSAEAMTVCLCVNQDFHQIIRDCTQRSCTTREEESKITSWITDYCQPAALLVARSAPAKTVVTLTLSEQSSTTSLPSSSSLLSTPGALSSSSSSTASSTITSESRTKSRASVTSTTISSSSSSSNSSGSSSNSKPSTLSTLTKSIITSSASPTSTPSSTTSSISTASTSTATPLTSPTPAPLAQPPLSPSAKAAIAGSISGSALFLSCIAFIVWHHARKSRKAHEAYNNTRRSMSTLDFNEYVSISTGKVEPSTTRKENGKGLFSSVKEKAKAKGTNVTILSKGRWTPSHSGGYVYSEVPDLSGNVVIDVAATNVPGPLVGATGTMHAGVDAGASAYEMNGARRSW